MILKLLSKQVSLLEQILIGLIPKIYIYELTGDTLKTFDVMF